MKPKFILKEMKLKKLKTTFERYYFKGRKVRKENYSVTCGNKVVARIYSDRNNSGKKMYYSGNYVYAATPERAFKLVCAKESEKLNLKLEEVLPFFKIK